jgi:sigma-B regulation protein RsbU (phosphoserine phosphatase)
MLRLEDAPKKGTVASTDTVRVLLIEDNTLDAELISAILSRARNIRFEIERSERLSGVAARAAEVRFDIVLTDLGLPDSSGINTFSGVSAALPDTPIIVLTGLDDEETALRAVHQGAQDYLVKGDISKELLLKSIRYSIERQKIRTELNTRIAEISKLERERENMLSMFAHDIKNALVPTVAFLEKIQSGKTDNMHDRLDRAIDNLMAVEHLLTNFMDFARLNAKGYRPHPSACDLDAVIRKQIVNAQINADKKNISIRHESAQTMPVLKADIVMIGRVIMNLLDNAVKYSDAGSLVIIRASEKDDELIVEVRDSGRGIPREKLPFIFDAFYRVAHDQKGAGLGLAISKTIVEAHGGTMRVESTLDRGSLFIFSLPKTAQEE